MIADLKNEEGYVYAYIEWLITDGASSIKNGGEYIYISGLWIHEDYKGTKPLSTLIHKVYTHEFSKDAKYVYWERDKYNSRVSKVYMKDTAKNKGVYHGK